MSTEEFLKRFPRLADEGFAVTSEADPGYNCIAWAAGDTGSWWEPDPMHVCYWPAGVRREYSLEAYTEAFMSLGYDLCDSAGLDEGLEKTALFAKGGDPSHAARQLPSGLWTSKLGRLEDIGHSLEGVSGSAYGEVTVILKRTL